MKQLTQVSLSIALVWVLIGCKKAPEFPKTPQISFLSLNKQTIYQNNGAGSTKKVDSVTIALYFKDGNGDLGRSDGIENYFCKVLHKVNDHFEEIKDTVENTIVNRNGSFMPLSPDGKAAPIEGTLYYGPNVDFGGYIIDTIYTLKFQTYIQDNAGNNSNIIETPEITVHVYDSK